MEMTFENFVENAQSMIESGKVKTMDVMNAIAAGLKKAGLNVKEFGIDAAKESSKLGEAYAWLKDKALWMWNKIRALIAWITEKVAAGARWIGGLFSRKQKPQPVLVMSSKAAQA